MISIIIRNLIKPLYFIKYKFYVYFLQNFTANQIFKRYKRDRDSVQNQKWEVLPPVKNTNTSSAVVPVKKARLVKSCSDLKSYLYNNVVNNSFVNNSVSNSISNRFTTRRRSTGTITSRQF
jgi:hypothetical protein